MTKTTCPITLAQFNASAKPLTLTLPDGSTVTAEVREFAKGSFGWYFGDKITVDVGGVRVKCQVGMSVTAIGSKEAARGETGAYAKDMAATLEGAAA